MIQRREHPGLALEAREPFGVRREGAGSTLIATSRPSLVSRARYTSPMPPAPISRQCDRARPSRLKRAARASSTSSPVGHSCCREHVGGEHGVDFVAQGAVGGAGLIEIARTGRRVARQRRVEHLGHLPPTLRRHAAGCPPSRFALRRGLAEALAEAESRKPQRPPRRLSSSVTSWVDAVTGFGTAPCLLPRPSGRQDDEQSFSPCSRVSPVEAIGRRRMWLSASAPRPCSGRPERSRRAAGRLNLTASGRAGGRVASPSSGLCAPGWSADRGASVRKHR